MFTPIGYDSLRRGFYYTGPVTGIPAMEVSAGEVVALCVAQKALAQYEGTSFQKQVTAALRKMTQSLQDKITFSWSELDNSISFHSVGTTESALATFETVSQAVLQRQELHFEYHKLSEEGYEPRQLQPYHLGCLENQWYAIGLDLQRGQLRTFALTRMREVQLMKKRFQRPANFSIHEYFSGSFGVFTGGKRHRIRIRFEGSAAQLVQERTWHSSQELTVLPGGEVEAVLLRILNQRAPERWVLSWGPRARVLAPRELVERVRKAAAETVQRYETA